MYPYVIFLSQVASCIDEQPSHVAKPLPGGKM